MTNPPKRVILVFTAWKTPVITCCFTTWWTKSPNHQMKVSLNRGSSKWMVYNGKTLFQMDDLGVPLPRRLVVQRWTRIGRVHTHQTCVSSPLNIRWFMGTNGGFLSYGGTPNHPKLNHVSIETHGDDWGSPISGNPHSEEYFWTNGKTSEKKNIFVDWWHW